MEAGPLRLHRCEEQQGAGPVLRASGSSHGPWHPEHPNGVTAPLVGRKPVPGPRPGSHRSSERAVGPGPCAPSPSFSSGGTRPRPAPCLCRDGWRTPARRSTPGREAENFSTRRPDRLHTASMARSACRPPPSCTVRGDQAWLALHRQRRRHEGPEANCGEQMLGTGLSEGPQLFPCPEGAPGGARGAEGPVRVPVLPTQPGQRRWHCRAPLRGLCLPQQPHLHRQREAGAPQRAAQRWSWPPSSSRGP